MVDQVYSRSLWRTHKCLTCKQEFKASRIDAQYCSGRCRVYWQRHGAPYPSVGTPEEVGPGVFDKVIEQIIERTEIHNDRHKEEEDHEENHKAFEPTPEPFVVESEKVTLPAKPKKGAKKNARKK